MKVGVGLIALFLALARAQEQQLTFGATTGAQLKNKDGASHGEQPQRGAKAGDADNINTLLAISTTSSNFRPTQSPSDLYALSLSLLTTLTSHASPPPPTTYTPLLQPSSYTPFLDLLESNLGSTAGQTIRAVRKAVGYVYGGSNAKSAAGGGRDWSVRGAVNSLKRALTDFAPLPTSKKMRGGRVKGEKGWREKLASMGTNGVLAKEEVEEGMKEVLKLARDAGEKGSAEAWVLLGDLYLTGHLTLKADPALAVEAYTMASEGSGNPEAQYKLGFLYGSNFGGALGGVEGTGKQGSALLHYTFAALSGHVPASMTVGYRHWVGIGTKQSCKDALGWYKSAADQAMRTFNAGPPGGRHLPPPKLRLSDLVGGVYGPGASASHRPQITGGSTSQTLQEWEDLLEFHHFHAERGDPTSLFRLGRLYYQGFGGNGLGGTRGGRGTLHVGLSGVQDGLWEGGRDFGRASKWFMRVATSVWSKDGKEATTDPKAMKRVKGEAPKLFYDPAKDLKLKADDHFTMVAGLSAGYLGKMYLRGEGVSVNYAKAFLWFMRGSGQGDRESNNGLGIMYRDGLGVERDLKKANLYFHSAAQQDLAEAQVNLGKYHFGMGDFVLATTYFEHAIRYDGLRIPDTFQSYYYLAELNARALNRADQCPIAVSFYKLVAERGDWEHEVWWEAERALGRGDERSALLGYWIMAERGYEQAQNNVAWILDRDKQRLRLPILDSNLAPNQTDRLALAYWTRSAAQDNVDALLKMGDYYYAGLGTDSEPQLEKAAACYQSAVNTRVSAMAMWNLGWMHEHGKGVARDYHMAKRYYDLALETSADAYFPATLSLISLYARALYHVLFTSPDDELKALALFGNSVVPVAKDGTNPFPAAPPLGQPWSFGRAWREIQRRWGIDPGPEVELPAGQPPVMDQRGAHGRREDVAEAQRALEANENPLEWGRGRRENARLDDEEDEFYVDGDGDLTGTLAIVALSVLLGWLLYFRQGRLPPDQALPPVGGGAGEGIPLRDAPRPIPPDENGEDDDGELQP